VDCIQAVHLRLLHLRIVVSTIALSLVSLAHLGCGAPRQSAVHSCRPHICVDGRARQIGERRALAPVRRELWLLRHQEVGGPPCPPGAIRFDVGPAAWLPRHTRLSPRAVEGRSPQLKTCHSDGRSSTCRCSVITAPQTRTPLLHPGVAFLRGECRDGPAQLATSADGLRIHSAQMVGID
jgi:hypothetical protein